MAGKVPPMSDVGSLCRRYQIHRHFRWTTQPTLPGELLKECYLLEEDAQNAELPGRDSAPRTLQASHETRHPPTPGRALFDCFPGDQEEECRILEGSARGQHVSW